VGASRPKCLTLGPLRLIARPPWRVVVKAERSEFIAEPRWWSLLDEYKPVRAKDSRVALNSTIAITIPQTRPSFHPRFHPTLPGPAFTDEEIDKRQRAFTTRSGTIKAAFSQVSSAWLPSTLY